MSQPRRSSRKKRQTQLSFSPVPSSSPAASQYPEQIQRRAAAIRYDSNISPTKKRRIAIQSQHKSPISFSGPRQQKIQIVIQSPIKTREQLPTPAPSSQVRDDCKEDDVDDDHTDDQGRELATGAKSASLIQSASTVADDRDATSGSDGDEIVTPVRKTRATRAVPFTSGSEADASIQELQESLTSDQNLRAKCGAINPSVEETPRTLSLSPHSQRNASKATPIGASQQRGPNGSADPLMISSGDENTSSEEEIVTPARKRRIAANVTHAPRSESPEGEATQELKEDAEDLDDTVIRKTRTRGRQDNSERSKRQRKLEELRQRRAGVAAETDDEEEASDYSSGSEPEPSYPAHLQGGNIDEYEDDFLDDDDDDTVGIDLGVAGVPLEFTYHANKKPFEHFKAEVEWMVHNKLNPAFERHDEIYLLAHRKLDKEVEQYGSAKFLSAAWKEPFVRALKSRPEVSRFDVPTMFEHKCDACQRSKHFPKNKLTFTGKRYNRDTLETIEDDDDDDDDDDDEDDEDDEDESHSNTTEEDEHFFLGRFCCYNAEMAHALHHWRYALNQTVLSWLAAKGHLDPDKIIERANMRQKKQERASNKVVDSMETEGVMKDLYKQFKENLEAARDAKPQRFSNSR